MSATLLQRVVGTKGASELPIDCLTDSKLEVFRMIGFGLSAEARREHIK